MYNIWVLIGSYSYK